MPSTTETWRSVPNYVNRMTRSSTNSRVSVARSPLIAIGRFSSGRSTRNRKLCLLFATGGGVSTAHKYLTPPTRRICCARRVAVYC